MHNVLAVPNPLCVPQLQASINRFEETLCKPPRPEFHCRRKWILSFPHPRVRTALHLHRIRRVPRPVASRHHAPQHGSVAVHVSPWPEPSVRDLLQRGVPLGVRGQRPTMLRHCLLRCSEVDQHRTLVGPPHQDVRRLDVPMNHSRSVNVRKPLCQRNRDGEQVGLSEWLTRGLSLPEQL